MRILMLLIAIPLIEIGLFIEIGGWIGVWPTLGLILLTAIVGMALMRRQGMRALRELRARAEAGQDPGGPLAHGALILVAGVLLVTPGFFTDTLGLLLLIPPVRARVIGWGAARVTVRAATFAQRRSGGDLAPRPAIIEADYEVIDTPPDARPGHSGWTRP